MRLRRGKDRCICGFCKKEFYIYINKSTPGKYCSRICKTNGSRGKPTKKRTGEQKICPTCKNTFYQPLWREKYRRKYCSYECVPIENNGRFKKGIKPHNWQEENVSYGAIHQWLRDQFGKADKCEMDTCNKISQKFHWALKKGYEYERKRENFWMLCASCHQSYDFTEDRRVKQSKTSTQVFINNHRAQNKLFTFNGKTQTLIEWCKELSISYDMIKARIYSHNWPIEKALTTPKISPKNQKNMLNKKHTTKAKEKMRLAASQEKDMY